MIRKISGRARKSVEISGFRFDLFSRDPFGLWCVLNNVSIENHVKGRIMAIDLKTATPAEIDTEWARVTAPIYAKIERGLRSMEQETHLINRCRNADPVRVAAEGRYETARGSVVAARTELKFVEAPFNFEWQARIGWSRAYKVVNANGHIHSSTNCQTCFPTTQFAWITELSGYSTDEIADLAGEAACTICYPNAPVAKKCQIFTQDEKDALAAKIVRNMKRAASADKKAAKAITDVDGSVLRDSYSYRIETLHSAKRELTRSLRTVLEHPDRPDLIERYTALADKLAKAIAHKTGESFEAIMESHMKKAHK